MVRDDGSPQAQFPYRRLYHGKIERYTLVVKVCSTTLLVRKISIEDGDDGEDARPRTEQIDGGRREEGKAEGEEVEEGEEKEDRGEEREKGEAGGTAQNPIFLLEGQPTILMSWIRGAYTPGSILEMLTVMEKHALR